MENTYLSENEPPALSSYAKKHSPGGRFLLSRAAPIVCVGLAGFSALAFILDAIATTGIIEIGQGKVEPSAFIVWAVCLALALICLWMRPGIRRRTILWQAWDFQSFKIAIALKTRLNQILLAGPLTAPGMPPGVVSEGPFKPGEIVRQFDAITTGAITGLIDHRLSFSGWGLAGATQRVGLGIGQLGLSGQSDVHLSLRAITRNDLLGEGFLAVLENPFEPTQVIRVVVPAKAAVDEFVKAFVESRTNIFPEGSHQATAMAGLADRLPSLGLDGSWVADRFSAAIRVDRNNRPTVRVVGLPIDDHTLLGGSFLFGDEDKWIEVIPFARLDSLERACLGTLDQFVALPPTTP